MPTNYAGPYGMYSGVVHNGMFDAAPPSNTFSPLTLRELGIDPNSQQYRDLSTPSPNGYAPGVSSAPSSTPGLGPVGDFFNGTGPNPSNPVIQTKPMQIAGPNYQTDPAIDPNQGERGGDIFGTGGPSGSTPNPNMDFFSILSQLHQLISQNSQINKGPNGGINSTTQPQPYKDIMPRITSIGGYLADQYGQPTQNKDPNWNPATNSYYGQPNQDYPYDPNQVRAMNPSATAGDTSPYDTGSGPFSLRSFAMGNRPGMRSPMGMTGGRFQHQTPGGYQGY